ncbi:hypothetical protein NLG97_g7062 [Lecanicillium saksenae]|uniref:Uncharacterized protein n=1 Tax=Lecanicillium saksenae TaxID=468837 RepID=A0ACC1QN04_9HYPO|nr:hypothetical protein NLG97_g7062 [Lecanicillium saksenae]
MRLVIHYVILSIATASAVLATDGAKSANSLTGRQKPGNFGTATERSIFWRVAAWIGQDAPPSTQKIEQMILTEQFDTREDVPMLLKFQKSQPHEAVSSGVKLRILPLGDSITVGYLSDADGGDGDGYRRQLKENLSGNEVVFAGTFQSGTMKDGRYAAWSGQTIQFIAEHADEALSQHPNVILLMAGTNDMNVNPNISRQGNDPDKAAQRLGQLVDKIIKACPDAVVLVAVILATCNADQAPQTAKFQKLIPKVVEARRSAGHRVLAVDFGSFGINLLRDCIHPTNAGYGIMGDYWYDFLRQVPEGWIRPPLGADPGEADSTGIRATPLSVAAVVMCKWQPADEIMICHLQGT